MLCVVLSSKAVNIVYTVELLIKKKKITCNIFEIGKCILSVSPLLRGIKLSSKQGVSFGVSLFLVQLEDIWLKETVDAVLLSLCSLKFAVSDVALSLWCIL